MQSICNEHGVYKKAAAMFIQNGDRCSFADVLNRS